MVQIIKGADDYMEVAPAGLGFIGYPSDDAPGGAGNDFDFKAEFFRHGGLERFAQFDAGRNAEGHFAFLLGRVEPLGPFGLPIGLSERDRRKWRQQQIEQGWKSPTPSDRFSFLKPSHLNRS